MLQSGQDLVTDIAIYKVQRGVIKKIHTQELWFLRCPRRPIKLNIRMKFHEDILNVFQVRDGHDFVTDGRPWQKQCLPILKEGGA